MTKFEQLYYSCFNIKNNSKKPLLQVIGGGQMATAIVEGFVNRSKIFRFY